MKRFSMIREFHMADWFTLGNAAAGTSAIFSMMNFLRDGRLAHFYWGCILVVIALIFDVFDGRIARWRQTSSSLGRELDSLADVISFGVAPAAIAYAAGMNGLLDRIILAYFVVCGVSRLARYNITAEALSNDSGKVSHFEGTPIPTSTLLVLILAALMAMGMTGPSLPLGEHGLMGGVWHPFVLLFAISGSLMISRIRIPKL